MESRRRHACGKLWSRRQRASPRPTALPIRVSSFAWTARPSSSTYSVGFRLRASSVQSSPLAMQHTSLRRRCASTSLARCSSNSCGVRPRRGSEAMHPTSSPRVQCSQRCEREATRSKPSSLLLPSPRPRPWLRRTSRCSSSCRTTSSTSACCAGAAAPTSAEGAPLS